MKLILISTRPVYRLVEAFRDVQMKKKRKERTAKHNHANV